MHQRATLASPRFEDFEYCSFEEDESDVLSWMGNGMILAQLENRPTTSYLDDVDIPPVPGLVSTSSSSTSASNGGDGFSFVDGMRIE